MIRVKNLIQDYGPRNIESGVQFNRHNGQNTFWVKLSSKLGNPSIVINGLYQTPIIPAYDKENNLLSFQVAQILTDEEVSFYFEIIDLMYQQKSEKAQISVLQNSPVVAADRLKEAVELSAFKSRKYHFDGLGLCSEHCLPWNTDPIMKELLKKIHKEIEDNFEFSFGGVLVDGSMDKFYWRTTILVYLIEYAIQSTKTNRFNFIECGVGDGITAYTAMTMLEHRLSKTKKHHSYLFDLWEDDQLIHEGIESRLKGVYSALNCDRTKNNLMKYKDQSTFIKGMLPKTLDQMKPHEELSFVHIDLNFADVTYECATKLFPRLSKGGVMLFDDYGWSPHNQTRQVLKDFIQNNGLFMMFPTGQAVLFKPF